jgi:hypothetical protein
MPVRPQTFTALLTTALSVAVLCFPAKVRAQEGLDLGASSFQFLKLPLSPRATAMGGAGAALAEGTGEAEINPAAGATGGGRLTLGQEYPPQEFGTNASHISWNLPWGARSLMLHARYLGFDEIPGWDEDNNASTPYEAHTLKLQAGLAGRNFGFDWGGNAAYARNNIADVSYAALLAGAGVRRGLPMGFSAGASATNVALWADKTRETGETVEPPLILQAGLGYVRPLKPGSRIAVALDARRVAEEDIVFPVGAEYQFMEALLIRAGYPVGDPDNGVALGFGLQWSRFAFNYAYKRHATLSGGHGWTLEIRDL